MQLSSIHCRAQEIVQRDRADAALLDNVRIVAVRAAVAWGREALAAEQREARHLRTRAIAELIALRNQRSHGDEDRSFSESPDRGFAQALTFHGSALRPTPHQLPPSRACDAGTAPRRTMDGKVGYRLRIALHFPQKGLYGGYRKHDQCRRLRLRDHRAPAYAVEATMDLDHLYSQHQIALISTSITASAIDHHRHLDRTADIAGQILRYQGACGAEAAKSWHVGRKQHLIPRVPTPAKAVGASL